MTRGVIALANCIPFFILFVKIIRNKGKKVFINTRFYILVSILLLNLIISLEDIPNYRTIFQHFDNNSRRAIFYLVEQFFKGVSTFSIIYFVFDKASKKHMNKYTWLFFLRIIFILGMVIIIAYTIILYEERNDDNSVKGRYRELKHCAGPDRLIVSIIWFLQILIFYCFVRRFKYF